MSFLNNILQTVETSLDKVVSKVQEIVEEVKKDQEMMLPTTIPFKYPIIPLQEIVIHSSPNTTTIYYVGLK